MGLWPGWGCCSELWQPYSGKIYCKVRCADRENVFLTHPRACLKKAFCKMYATICGRFDQDEGAVACYDNQLRIKYTAKWDVQIAKWFFKYISEFFSYCFVVFQLCAVLFYLYTIFLFQSELFKSIFPHDNVFFRGFLRFHLLVLLFAVH